MKKLGLMALLMTVPLIARAADVGRVPPDWRWLMNLGGKYVFLDRLGLTEDQKKALTDIQRDWSEKSSAARAATLAAVPKLTGDEAKDPQKRQAHQAAVSAAWKKGELAPPTEQIEAILTPEQRQKFDEAGKIVADWQKAVADQLAACEKQLAAILGPAPENPDRGVGQFGLVGAKYKALDLYLKGTSSLGSRIGLSKQQQDALEQLLVQSYNDSSAMMAPLNAALDADKEHKLNGRVIRMAIGQKYGSSNEKFRAAVEKILTQEQRDKLTKTSAVLEARDKALVESHKEYSAKVDRVLPPVEHKVGDVPALPPGAAGGM